MIRLDKYLAEMRQGSRQEVKQAIRKGVVCVDGQVVKSPELKINSDSQEVTYSGKVVAYMKYEYYMLNKPAGVISATEGQKEMTAVDLIKSRMRRDLFPVGRLDKDTEGLLLITNDGALAHRLLSPKKHVDKIYYAVIEGQVTGETVQAFAEGMDIGRGGVSEMTRPAVLHVIERGLISTIRLTLKEGKYHQVKRMFEAVGMRVRYLKREAMGSLLLDESLSPGEYRKLTQKELEQL